MMEGTNHVPTVNAGSGSPLPSCLRSGIAMYSDLGKEAAGEYLIVYAEPMYLIINGSSQTRVKARRQRAIPPFKDMHDRNFALRRTAYLPTRRTSTPTCPIPPLNERWTPAAPQRAAASVQIRNSRPLIRAPAAWRCPPLSDDRRAMAPAPREKCRGATCPMWPSHPSNEAPWKVKTGSEVTQERGVR